MVDNMDFPWDRVPMRCDGAAQIDPHYDAYPECARPCLGCPDYTWTYQGSSCAKEQHNATAPIPCCPVPQHPWRSYYPEVWGCVSAQCAEKKPGSEDRKSYEVAQAVFTQFGRFCAEDMKTPLYEFWKGAHFHAGYEMQGFAFERLPDPEVAVSGYYGWGVLAAWHLGLIAAVIAGLRHIPYSKPPKQTDTMQPWKPFDVYHWTANICSCIARVYRRVAHEARWLWHADTELILALIVVWIAIGDISLRGEMLSPMDVLVRPRIDAVPPGYDPILATHLLTVRAAMSVLDSFISLAFFVMFTSWWTRPWSRGWWYWWPLSSRRLHFRVVATLVTAVAGIAVTAKRGICPDDTKGFCTANSMMDAVISSFGLRRFGRLGLTYGAQYPAALMHFVRGLWIPWPLNPSDSYSEYRLVQTLFMGCFGVLGCFFAIMTYGFSDSGSSFLKRLQPVGQCNSGVLKSVCTAFVIIGHLIFIFLASVLPGLAALGCFLTLVYLIQGIIATKTVLGPAPNVSFQELDQILAIVVGGITAIISMCGSVYSFMQHRSRQAEYQYYQLSEEED